VVVLMTPDDLAYLKEEFRHAGDPPHEVEATGQARPNVLFEAGMAMGRDEGRTVLVELGALRPFSDVGGRHVIRLNNTTQRRQEFATRLQAAECPVDLTGTDWHSAGDFDAAVK
jgi:predicted nucleotide-binding protein